MEKSNRGYRSVRIAMLCVMSLVIAVSFMPMSTFAAGKTAKQTCYLAYKEKNSVYVHAITGVYRVTVKKGKAKKKKKIVKLTNKVFITNVIKKGKYVYYIRYYDASQMSVHRVKASGGKAKLLASVRNDQGEDTYDYMYMAIKGKTIYYTMYQYNGNKKLCMQMDLDGKNKKKSSVRAVSKYKKTNKKGYKLHQTHDGKYTREYLKTPKGKKLLAKTTWIK